MFCMKIRMHWYNETFNLKFYYLQFLKFHAFSSQNNAVFVPIIYITKYRTTIVLIQLMQIKAIKIKNL